MHRVLGTLVAGRNHRSDTPSDAKVQVLKSASCLFDSTSPEVISSTSVYAATSSCEEAEDLAEIAHQLAIKHHLLALVEFGDGRLRVKFLSVPSDLGGLNGG